MKFKNIFIHLLTLVYLYLLCILMMNGTGLPHAFRMAIPLMTLLIFLNWSKVTFWFIAFPICFLYALYLPIGFMFGKPDSIYIASLLSTDLLESKEFISQLPLFPFLLSFLIIIGIVLYRYITIKYKINFCNNKNIIIPLIIASMIHSYPFELFGLTMKEWKKAKNEIMNVKNAWGDVDLVNSMYDNYVLIIGESARTDYHNAYGYKLMNTPFMSSSKGVLVKGLKSGGTNTISSLRLMLTNPNKAEWEPNYSLNIIDLVKSAGIKTYWLSNQGFTGKYDNAISYLANKSDEKYFTKYREFDSKNISDFELIPQIKKVIDINDKGKKLIVIHLMGSHSNACQRIVDYENKFEIKDKKYAYLSCYIASINKTDDFIKQVNEYLEQNYQKEHKSYSMIYFSDHGQSHYEDNDEIKLNHIPGKFSYDIPLFKTSSNDEKRIECSVFKSGLNFTDGLASWIGLKNDHLKEGYNLFDCKDDIDDYGLSDIIRKMKAAPDPAIDIE